MPMRSFIFLVISTAALCLSLEGAWAASDKPLHAASSTSNVVDCGEEKPKSGCVDPRDDPSAPEPRAVHHECPCKQKEVKPKCPCKHEAEEEPPCKHEHDEAAVRSRCHLGEVCRQASDAAGVGVCQAWVDACNHGV